MKRAVTLLAFAGLSSAAVGQSLSVNLSFNETSTGVGTTITATLSASFTGHPAGAYISSINIDLIASIDGAEVSNVAAVAWNNAALGFDGQGTASGSDVLGIEAAQFSLIPPVTAGSPILITTFTLTSTCGQKGVMSYSARVSEGAPFAFSVTGGTFDDPVVGYGVDAFSSGSLVVCPAPGCVGFGMIGLLAGAVRRRGSA